MLDHSFLKNAYETNPIAFLLLQVVRQEGQPLGLEALYANPAALARKEYPKEKLNEVLLRQLGSAWFHALCDTGRDVQGKTVYDVEEGRGFRLDCFPCGVGICGCMIQEWKETAYCAHSRDPLTGALNFDSFKEEAVHLMQEKPDRNYAVWYCDIKRFKYINDVFGYEAGDRLLCRWAEAIRSDLREGECFGRIAGDQMAVLTWFVEVEELERRFWTPVNAIRHELNHAGQSFEVEIKAGAYRLKPGECRQPNINQMLDWANVAQKSVKASSGSCMAFFTEELWRRQLRELEIGQHVRAGIEAGEFSAWLQPQYDYLTNRLCGAEVLVQWNHPSLGMLSPAEFIPILERDGQITALDWYMWEEACRIMRRWLDQGKIQTTMSLSVNMSRVDVWDEELCERICELVRRYDLPSAMLRLEITESAYMEESEQIIAVARQLRESGFTVEMDDFGSGYSSLNMLKDVPVDIVKLDMHFLSGADNTFRSGNILSSVIRMAHWLELPVIAEGVENRQQAEYLKSLGCYVMQGYYFARPMPAEEFEVLLDTLPAGNMERSYPNVGLQNMAEFLDTESKSSFLFTHCIGGGALVEYDGENTEALMVNDAFCDVIGMDRQSFESYRRHALDVIDPEDQPVVRQAMEEAVREGASICVVRITDQRGETRRVRVRHQYLSSNLQRRILFALVEDITVQHQMRARLDEVTEEFRSYLDLMPGGVVRYAADEEGQLAFVSRGLLEMLGYTSE